MLNTSIFYNFNLFYKSRTQIILGLAAYFAYQQITRLSHLYKFPAAFFVMQLYLGSAAFFYFLVEKIIILPGKECIMQVLIK